MDKHVNAVPADFSELVARAGRGDADAAAQLVREYESEVRIIARVRLGAALRPYLDSVDLVQSVHRSVLIGLRGQRFSIETPENLIALALTIVRRKVARQWRRMQRQRRLSGEGRPNHDVAEQFAQVSSPDWNPQAEASIRDQVEQLLGRLDGVERRLIELRLDGYSTAEAARELNLNADVLRVRLNRLRKRLQAEQFATDWL